MAASRILHVLALAVIRIPMTAQLDTMLFDAKVPQAQSRQELDAYLDVVQAQDPYAVLTAADRFHRHFASSDFAGYVYRLEMQAHADMSDGPKLLAAGERALALNPHDIETLLMLARALTGAGTAVNRIPAQLAQAEGYARKALEETDTLKAPRTMPLDEWERMLRRFRSSAHECLGALAYERGSYRQSIAEFEESARLSPATDGAQQYRLGMAYLAAGNRDQAVRAFSQAASLGPEAVRARAHKRLSTLDHFTR